MGSRWPVGNDKSRSVLCPPAQRRLCQSRPGPPPEHSQARGGASDHELCGGRRVAQRGDCIAQGTAQNTGRMGGRGGEGNLSGEQKKEAQERRREIKALTPCTHGCKGREDGAGEHRQPVHEIAKLSRKPSVDKNSPMVLSLLLHLLLLIFSNHGKNSAELFGAARDRGSGRFNATRCAWALHRVKAAALAASSVVEFVQGTVHCVQEFHLVL